MGKREQFLAGERPEDVAIYLADAVVDDPDALADYGQRVADGVLLIVPGENGRAAFSNATGTDAMTFAQEAMDGDGEIDPDLTGGTCPECENDDVRIVFAFAEERNEEVGGIYAEGDVIHAYARCADGTAFSQKWVAGER